MFPEGILSLQKGSLRALPFNEDNIISLGIPGITKEEILKALLLLKAESFIGEKFYYKAQGTYSGFAKNYLMRHGTSRPKTK